MKRERNRGRRRVIAVILTLAFALALLAPIAVIPSCEEGKPVRALETLRDQACACESAACASETIEPFVALLREHVETEFSPGPLERMNRAGYELSECIVAAGVSEDEILELFLAIEALR